MPWYSWFSSASSRPRENADEADPESQPLLSTPHDETALQTKTHQKLHTYMILRALSAGYLPTTPQTIAHLRSTLSLDVLNPTNTALTPSGRKLVRDLRRFLHALIDLLQNKNPHDQLQEFLWCTARARAGFDGGELVDAAVGGAQGSGPGAAYEAVRTLADLLMANREFRRLCADLATLGRQVLSDTAEAGAEAAHEVGEVVKPSEGEMEAVGSKIPVDAEEEQANGNGEQGKKVAEVLEDGVQHTALAAVESAERGLKEEGRGDALLERLKRAVLRLRGRADYTESVSVVSMLLKRYAVAYSRSLSGPAGAVAESIHTNSELDDAVKKFWDLITSFGDEKEWGELMARWNKLMGHIQSDQEFEALMNEIGDTLQDVLTDPSFADSGKIEAKLKHLRTLASEMGPETSTTRKDLDRFLEQVEAVFAAVLNDTDINNLTKISRSIFANVWPSPYTLNPDIVSDATHVLVPLLLSTIQYIPILRFTLATPEVDLLLENLILEPGDTVNASSFFPHLLRLETDNTFELRKARHRYASSATSIATVHLRGLTIRADDVGYWLRAHTGVWRFWDEGIVSVRADEQGVDITLDVEFARDRIENLVTLRNVEVNLHKLDYVISRSRYRWLAWPFKPVLRPILRRVVRNMLKEQITECARVLNREVVFARERLRATRVAQPATVWRFIRAVAARLKTEPSQDLDVGVGIRSSKAEPKVFEGKYAPGSIVKLWEEEGEQVAEIVDVGAEGAWRNSIFDLVP